MSKTVLSNASFVLAALVACAVALLVAPVKPAEAAFPGQNGDIAFSSFRDDLFFHQIFVVRRDGSEARVLPVPGINMSPEWSPDGERLAFWHNDSDTEYRAEIYLMSPDGSGVANLTNSPNAHEAGFAWYPSGDKIAFCAAPTEASYGDLTGDFEIYSVSLDGSGHPADPPTQLTDNDAYDCPSSVSSKGRLAFLSDRDGDREIYTMGANRREGPANPDLQLTRNRADDGEGDWSPNGKKLAFARTDPTTFTTDIYTMRADGTGKKNLTRSAQNYDRSPTWSPNGKKLAFESIRPDGEQGSYEGGIWKMRADGTRKVRLTSVYGDGNPSWQPLP